MIFHFDRLLFSAPFLLVTFSFATAVTTKKILNAPGANPTIVDRTTNPTAYWGQLSLRGLFAVVMGWMAVAVIFHAP